MHFLHLFPFSVYGIQVVRINLLETMLLIDLERKCAALTLVACMSCCQWRSRIAGFCNSPTALNDVTMFLTVESSPENASQARISLSSPRISFTNLLHSISMFSTLMSLHSVSFHSSMLLSTTSIISHSCFSKNTSLRQARSCL